MHQLLLTLVHNETLEILLADIKPWKYKDFLLQRGWVQTEASKAPGVNMLNFTHPDVNVERRFMGGREHTCHVLSLPAPHCFEKGFSDVGRRCWELIEDVACLEQRSPVAVLCEIEPKACDWLDQSMPCKSVQSSSVGS